MMSDTTHYVSYWENAPGQTMPAYVALALVSMRRALGDRFLLLTSRSVSEHIDADIMNKAWAFEPLSFTLANGIEAIVAKSDFIRMAFVLKWFTEFGHLNRGDMLTSEQHRCHNEKKKFQRRV
ncbi:hypothetical protein [Klebsiella michiganensis]|uniref:hypothetical protein n=1 Tax=Klebsiella michiganensis TaxID=1134687 RepID=UPI00398443C2